MSQALHAAGNSQSGIKSSEKLLALLHNAVTQRHRKQNSPHQLDFFDRENILSNTIIANLS